jgi:hypothetical protein
MHGNKYDFTKKKSIQKHNTMLIWYSKIIELQNAKTTWENTNVLIKKLFLNKY